MSDIEQIKKILLHSKGKFFSVKFTKKDGTLRKMVCRTGVKSYLKGGVNTTGHIPNLLTVFDVQKQEYRNINMATLQSARVEGKEYSFEENSQSN